MQILSNDSKQRATSACLQTMLLNSEVDDQTLVIATGTIGYPRNMISTIATWLRASDSRRILFVIGLHGKLEYSEYLDVQAIKDPYLPLTYEACGGASIKSTFELWVKALFAAGDFDDRIIVFAVEHFHAKLYMLLGRPDENSDYLQLEVAHDVDWNVQEAILGSTNMTSSALDRNFEMDIHIQRTNPMIADLATHTLSLIEGAIATITKANTSGRVTHELEAVVAAEVERRQGQSYNAEVRKINAIRREMEVASKAADEDRARKDSE